MLSRSKLLFAASSLLTACLSESDSDGSNYFVDLFEGGVANLPYPVNQCVVIGLSSPAYGMYSCSSDGSTVTKTVYTDATCETAAEGVDAVEYTSDDVAALGLYDFNCDGVDDYAAVDLCLSAAQDTETGDFDCSVCSVGPLESWQATGVCFNAGAAALYASVIVECDGDSVDADYYASCAWNDTDTAIQTNSAGDTCTSFTAIDDLTLYWTYAGCYEDGESVGNNEDLAVRLSMTHSVVALVMVVSLIKLFV